MANKIVLIPKFGDQADGTEYPLDVDTSTDGIGIAHAYDYGADYFWVGTSHTGNRMISLYQIDRQNDQATLEDEFQYNGNGLTGITYKAPYILLAQKHIRGNAETIRIDQWDTRGKKLVKSKVFWQQSAGLTATTPGDITFDKTQLWWQWLPGTVGAVFRLRNHHYDLGGTGHGFNVGSPNNLARGVSVEKEGDGIWWIDSSKNLRKVRPSGFENIIDPITLTHSGTMRCMDDAGPYLAFMMN
jgi:hypothetical protein